MWIVFYVSLVSMKHLVFVPLVQPALFLWLMWTTFVMLGFLYEKEVAKFDG